MAVLLQAQEFRSQCHILRLMKVTRGSLKRSIPAIKLDTLRGGRKGDPKHECCGKKSTFRLDPKLMHPQYSKENQNVAWTRSLCIPKTRKMSKFRLDPKLVYPPKSNKSKFRLDPKRGLRGSP